MTTPVGGEGPRWTRLDYDERRAQILTAARKLFSRRRYSSVSMKDIADEAGVARGLLHHYFGSKHDLYLEVTRELLRLPTIPVPEGVTDAHLWARSVDAWLDMIDANRDSWLAAMRAGETGDDPDVREVLDEASELVAERVIEALGIDDTSPEMRAVVRCYGGLAQEATREWLERKRLSREQVRALLVGAMPLMASELLPDVKRAGKKRSRRSA